MKLAKFLDLCGIIALIVGLSLWIAALSIRYGLI